ncbi:MAG TPA: hypothetical protein VL357_11915 [Rariglobus sp.]|nr:hypothetical protein [Rariglobus sp.]
MVWFIPSLLLADADTKSTVEKFIGAFAHLDTEWRAVSASAGAPSDLKKYEIELQKTAETFFVIANSERKKNPELSEAAGVTGNLIVDSAYVIFTGGEKKQPASDILKAHARKIAFLPNIYLGVITSLAPSKTKPEGFLSQEEIEALRQMIAKEFGAKIAGPKSINGDNGFAQAGSLTDGFMKALKK